MQAPNEPAVDGRAALDAADDLALSAAGVGFDWPDLEGVLAKVHEELGELEEALARRAGPGDAAVRHELGDLLQALANLGRHAGTPAEQALQSANARFRARFTTMERLASARGQRLEALDAEAQDRLWREAKATLDRPSPDLTRE